MNVNYFLILSISTILLFYGCSPKDNCNDLGCLNGGICVDGTCLCNEGYCGDFCEKTENCEDEDIANNDDANNSCNFEDYYVDAGTLFVELNDGTTFSAKANIFNQTLKDRGPYLKLTNSFYPGVYLNWTAEINEVYAESWINFKSNDMFLTRNLLVDPLVVNSWNLNISKIIYLENDALGTDPITSRWDGNNIGLSLVYRGGNGNMSRPYDLQDVPGYYSGKADIYDNEVEIDQNTGKGVNANKIGTLNFKLSTNTISPETEEHIEIISGFNSTKKITLISPENYDTISTRNVNVKWDCNFANDCQISLLRSTWTDLTTGNFSGYGEIDTETFDDLVSHSNNEMCFRVSPNTFYEVIIGVEVNDKIVQSDVFKFYTAKELN